MRIEQMRSYISDAYPGDKWKARCACMKRNQVMAIYYSLLEKENRIPKGTGIGHFIRDVEKAEQNTMRGIQITMDDYIWRCENEKSSINNNM